MAALQVDAFKASVIGIVDLDQAIDVAAEIEVEANRALHAVGACRADGAAARGGEANAGIAELAVDQHARADGDADAPAGAEIPAFTDAVGSVAQLDAGKFVDGIGAGDDLATELRIEPDLAAVGNCAVDLEYLAAFADGRSLPAEPCFGADAVEMRVRAGVLRSGNAGHADNGRERDQIVLHIFPRLDGKSGDKPYPSDDGRHGRG